MMTKYRSVDTLGRLLQNGSITEEMHAAGLRVRDLFERAKLDVHNLADHLPVRGPCDILGHSFPGAAQITEARNELSRMVRALGGMNSPAGSIAWFVICGKMSVKEWAIEHGWAGHKVSQEAAAGILIACLGALNTICSMVGTG